LSFRIFNIDFKVSFYCFVAFALFARVDSSCLLVTAIFSALFHESGHFLAMVFIGKKVPKKVVVTPFGARIYNQKLWELSELTQLIIYLSGPFANVILCIIALIFFGEDSKLFTVNMALAMFNMLPVLPLDGGNSAKCFFSMLFKADIADIIIEVISACALFTLAVIGFIYLFRQKNNYSLFMLTVYLCFLFLNRSGFFKNKDRTKKGIKNVS